MDQHILPAPRLPAIRMSRVLTWLAGIVCYSLMLSVLALIVRQIIVPPPAQRVLLIRTIPLPEGLKAKGAPDSLAPGFTQDFDNFGYQAIDPIAHLLFIAHTSPIPYNYSLEDRTFHWDDPSDIARDGNVLVFDLQQQKLVGRVPIPRPTGLVVAPDLHTVFVSGSEQSRIYSFDERTLTNIKFLQLADNDDPDTLSYDPLTHKLFVAVPGAHVRYPIKVPGLAQPILNENIDPARENVYILDAPTLHILGKINIGKLPKLPDEDLSNTDFLVPTVADNAPKFGYFIGQIKYNDKTHLLYLVIQVASDSNIRPHPLPPPGTAELVTINPATNTIIQRTILPESCSRPHALALDPTQQIAYLDCTNEDDDIPLVQHVIGVDLSTKKAFPDDPRQTMLAPAPNMLAVDRPQQLLFEACAGGITVFDARPGRFHKLGNYVVGRKATSIIVDESTQSIYLPIAGSGGRPTLVIAKYNPRGI